MAMFTAYFDCSGTPAGSAPVLAVSGAVSTLDKWLKFEREWVAILVEHGVSQPFHMSEFMNQFGSRPTERDLILSKLSKVIRKRTNKTFCTAVMLDDWRKVNEQYELAEQLYYPFPLAALYTLVKLEKWKQRNGIPEPIERIFEDGDLHRDEFIQLIHEWGAPIPIFKTKELVPLQVGDCIAWQNAKTIGRVTRGVVEYWHQIPDLYWRLINQEQKAWGIFETDNMIAFCEERGVPKRQTLRLA